MLFENYDNFSVVQGLQGAWVTAIKNGGTVRETLIHFGDRPSLAPGYDRALEFIKDLVRSRLAAEVKTQIEPVVECLKGFVAAKMRGKKISSKAWEHAQMVLTDYYATQRRDSQDDITEGN